MFHVSGVRSRETRNLFSTFEGLTMIRSTGIPVGEGGRGGSVADGDEVPELRRLGHRGAHRRAAGEHDHLLRTVVEQVVHHGGALPGVALQQENVFVSTSQWFSGTVFE